MYQLEIRYCSYCSAETEHEINDHPDAPEAICRGCNKERF